jgi:hypothetical protein
MNDETTVGNDAGEATSHAENGSSRALTGKIAQLPKDIREEFNRRLDDGQPASVILPWVNGLPATKKILEAHFDGLPINERNLSVWRRNGHKRWLEKQESLAELKELAEDTKDFSDATGGTLARGMASIAAAKILKMLQAIPATPDSLEALTKVSYAVSALMNAEQGQVRLEYEKTRVFQGNERLVLSWDKFLRGCIETAQRALNDAICKDIQAADIDNGEKIELLGYELFGKKWKGREVGKKEEAEKKKPEKEPEGLKKESAETAEPKKTEGQMADQQVRPTMTPDNGAEVKVAQAAEKAEVKETDAHVPTEAMDSKAPAIPPEPKQEPPARELSPYEKAILGGQTFLSALYAQFTPDPNPKPKPNEDPSVPKPSAWDSFSEPVKTPRFAYRPEPPKNVLG